MPPTIIDPPEPATLEEDTKAQESLAARFRRWAGPLEVGFGVLLTLASVYLHVRQMRVAGGLWRDEATSVQMANAPSLGVIWQYVEFDSYPPLFHLLLRGWAAVLPTSDLSYRVFGLVMGLTILGALWAGVRKIGAGAPLLALALLGLNPSMIRYGDSIRAYGLGCALAIWAFCAVWAVARSERLEWRRIAWAALAAVLSVQCLYHNAALLLATCLGGAAVALWNRRVKVAAAVLAVGLPAALSLLPYLPAIRRTRVWSILIRFPVSLRWLWHKVSAVTGSPDPVGVWLWAGLAAVAVIGVGWMILRKTEQPPEALRRRLFCGVTLATGVTIYAAFLFSVGYVTQPWYYLAILSLAVVCLDGIFGQAAGLGWRGARLLIALLFSSLVFEQSIGALQVRSTNVDRVARQLNANVKAGDLVLVNRWECAISLQRYYHGAARFMTVPAIEDHMVHRYDLYMERMLAKDPLRPVFDAIDETLKGGRRVWLVGPRDQLAPGEPMPHSPPALLSDKGTLMRMTDFYHEWLLSANEYLFRHATSATDIPGMDPRLVSEFEYLPLGVLEGWSETPVTPAAP